MREVAFAAVIALAAALPAQASNLETFEAADYDGNGRISETEFLGVFPYLELEPMRMADTDRDGTLSKREFTRAGLPVTAGLEPAIAAGQLPEQKPEAGQVLPALVAAERIMLGRHLEGWTLPEQDR